MINKNIFNLILISFFITTGIIYLSCSSSVKLTSMFKEKSSDKIAVLIKANLKKNETNPVNKYYFDSLDSAFSACESGDSLIIREGTYRLDKALELWEKNNVNVIGEGKCNLICNNINDNVMWIITCQNILVKNIHATHTQPGSGKSCVGNVFALDMGNGITIEDCDINGCGAIGVYIFGTTNITLRNNIIHDNTHWAVQYNDEGMQKETETENIKFENNKIFNNGNLSKK